MPRPTQRWMLAVSFPVLLAFLVFMLFTEPKPTGMVTSDGGYTSPTSDGSYKSPTADGSYKPPTSDNAYKSPTSDQNYSSPKTGPGYTAPTSDRNYSSPTTGPGYLNATTGEGYIKPKIGEGYKAPSVGPGLNITTGPGYTQITVGPGFLMPEIGPGFFQAIASNSSADNITIDITVTKNITTIVVLNHTIGNETTVILNTTKIDFTNYTNLTENETTDKIKDLLLDVLNKTLEEEHSKMNLTINKTEEPKKEHLLDANLVGTWRIYTQTLYSVAGSKSEIKIDDSGNVKSTRLPPSPIRLVLNADGTWQFGSSSGKWLVMPQEPNDKFAWIMASWGTRKLVLQNWNEGTASGPIDEAKGDIILWVIYNTDRGQVQMSLGKLGGHEAGIAASVVGQGSVQSEDKSIDCDPACSAKFSAGSKVKLTAKPANGWAFEGWTGSCVSAQPICEITIEGAHSVTAKFQKRGCEDDSECPLDRACNGGACGKIDCACGTVKNHACETFGCCSDAQCGEGGTCNLQVHQCFPPSGCREYLKKGDPKEKFDIVFVGDGFTDYETMQKLLSYLLDYEGKYNGMFSVTPFRENKDIFNIWMVIAPDYRRVKFFTNEDPYFPNGTHYIMPEEDDYLRFVNNCERDMVVVLSRTRFRSYSKYPTTQGGGNVYFALNIEPISPEYIGRILVHEFGHAIGDLTDEYVEYGKASYNLHKVNCALNLEDAKKKWGDLEGIGGVGYYTGIQDVPGTTYYKSPTPSVPGLGFFPDGSDWGDGGCSYEHKNIRPTASSVMKDMFDTRYWYGPVGERAILKRLEPYMPSPSQGTATHQVIVQKSGRGLGTITSSDNNINCGSRCSFSYGKGSKVTLTASPAGGSTFSGWTGACTGKNTVCSFTVDEELITAAEFDTKGDIQLELKMNKIGSGKGAISYTAWPLGPICDEECTEDTFPITEKTKATLIAKPMNGSVFSGWSGACTTTQPICTFMMDSKKSVTARFDEFYPEEGYLVIVNKTGDGRGGIEATPLPKNKGACGLEKATCYFQYDKPEYITLKPVPANGSVFSEWGGDCRYTSKSKTECKFNNYGVSRATVEFGSQQNTQAINPHGVRGRRFVEDAG